MGVPDASRTRRRLLSWGSATLAMAFGTLTMPLCPAHHLPLDRHHLWGPLADAFMCRECESLYQARLAARVPLIPDIPANATNAEAMQILCDMMPAGGDGWAASPGHLTFDRRGGNLGDDRIAPCPAPLILSGVGLASAPFRDLLLPSVHDRAEPVRGPSCTGPGRSNT